MPVAPVQFLAPHTRALLFDPPADRDEALRRCALAPDCESAWKSVPAYGVISVETGPTLGM